MSNRNQGSFNPNHYPNQAPYGNYQPGVSPGNGQGDYHTNQQSVYYPAGTSNTPYNYPPGQGGPEFTYAPAFPMAQGGPQGYAGAEGHYAMGTAPWAGGSGQHPVNAGYQAIYGSTDPARALTPPPVGHPSWTGAYPIARSSTPQASGHGQPRVSYQNQPISLTEGSGGSAPGGSSDQRKYRCSICTSPHSRKADLDRHIRSVHTQESPYQCLGCGERFVRSDARGLHWKNVPTCHANHVKKEGH